MTELTLYRSKTEVELSEKKKLNKKYFEAQANYYIAFIGRQKDHIKSARNYYASQRDPLDFEYLEDIYGMSNPVDLGFTNIIKPRIKALVGLSILSEPDFRVAYNDQETIESVKAEAAEKFVIESLGEIQSSTDALNKLRKEGKRMPARPNDRIIAQRNKIFLEALHKKYGENYIVPFLAGAQSLINEIQTDSDIDFTGLKKDFAKDYFVTGEAYTRTIYVGDGKDPRIEHIPAEDVFTNRPVGDKNLKNADVVVSRKKLTAHGILKELGDKISRKDAESLFLDFAELSNYYNIPDGAGDAHLPEASIPSGEQLDVMQQQTTHEVGNQETYYLYHIEWLASTRIPGKKKGEYVYREDRYETYRIGEDRIIGWRRCDEAPRRKDTPWKTTLSYTGLINTDKDGSIQSMVNDMREVQDMYDIMRFFRNNTVANSGVSGSRVNVAAIPKNLGKKFMDRLTKWITLRKQGLELIDPTEEGANLFQHYGDFDASINGNSIMSINAIIESLTIEADIISGVPRQILGIIEERDAVENVRVGLNQVSVLSLESFRDIDRGLSITMQKTLDMYKLAYKGKVKAGVARHGNRLIPFSIDDERFSTADYKISVISSGIENAKLIKIHALAKEFVAGGLVPPDVIVRILNKKSVREIEHILEAAMKKQKEENNNLAQMQGQLEESSKVINQLKAEIDRLNNNRAAMEKEKLSVEKDIADGKLAAVNRELDLKERTLYNVKDRDDKTIGLKKDLVVLQKEQLIRSTGNDRKVNHNI